MLSCESDRRQTGWNSSSGSFTDSMQSSSSRDYSTGGSSHSSSNFISPSHESNDEVYSTLPELAQVPWTEGDLLAVLQRGQLKKLCGNISIECLQRFAYLLQRPLTRIAREAERLCASKKCSKQDIVTASKLVLSPVIFGEANKFAAQSTMLHSLSRGDNNCSKSSLSSLTLSVGKHQRWLLEALPAAYVHELSAVYLTAIMESIIEQTACLALQHLSERILRDQIIVTTDMLEAGIRTYSELHSLYNPSSLLLTADWRSNTCSSKAVERNLASQCIASVEELTDTVSQAMHYWRSKSTRNSTLQWSSSAINTLFYFTKCSRQESSSCSVTLRCPRRNSTNSPPIVEWVRLATIFTEHRRDHVIDNDDVMQVARLLLPAVDCPPRSSRSLDTISISELADSSSAEVRRKFGLFLLSSRVTELRKLASTFINKSDVDCFNNEGVTPLMASCTNGDVSTTVTLLKSGASVDMAVSSHHSSFPGWTALCFAVSNGHLDTAQLLLDYGCNVDGAADSDSAETPLQLASAAGHLELVGLLLKYHANPHQQTCVQKGMEVKGTFNPYTLAASHGRRDVVRWLFSDSLQIYNKKLLTLSEMLAECNESQSSTDVKIPPVQQKQDEEENEYMVIENDYVTIEEVQQHDEKYEQLKKKLSPFHIHSLQSAMYQAAESGFLDLTLEIHSAGVPWTTYAWYMTLNTAHVTQRKAVVQSLLRDFNSIDYENNTVELCEACLSLMFEIFRESKNEMVSQQLAVIFSQLYGSQPVPMLKAARSQPSLLIQSSYVNSKEMADVSFVVEGKIFYAHQVILASASMRFKNMLSAFAEVAMPEIEIRDIGYDTFERVMRYVYEGTCISKISSSVDFKSVKRLLGAAHYFQLDALKRKSEILLSKNLSVDNCLSVYKAAKMYSCMELMEICEAYFLQHFNRLLAKCEEFKRILYSSKVHNRELMARLSNALAARLHSNLLAKKTNTSTAL